MKINRLLLLEIKRNSLRPYYIAVFISDLCLLGFIYLMAAIPKIDPYDSDTELFNSYSFIIGLTMVVMMGIFIIVSATVASKVIVDEYREKKAMLLFLYPISRKKIMGAKIILVFIFTFVLMLLSGACIFTTFIITESIYPICIDAITMELVIRSIIDLISYAAIAGCCGIVSSWIGFMKKSPIGTVIASCIIMIIVCQMSAMTFFSKQTMMLLIVLLGVVSISAAFGLRSQVEKMEV